MAETWGGIPDAGKLHLVVLDQVTYVEKLELIHCTADTISK